MESNDGRVSGADECERSLALAGAARACLLANGLPPTPRNYELWYTYALKNNPALNRDIDALLAAGSPPAESDLEALYETHFGIGRMLGRMQTIGSGLGGRLGDVVGIVSAALGSASDYGDSLDLAERKLATSDDPAAVLAVVKALAAATLRMREQGLGLKARLEGATREIECPQVLEVDGRWFLVFSTWPHLCSDEVRAEHGTRLRPGTYAMAGEGPDGPFRLLRPEPIVAADHPVQPYAGQVLAIADGHVLIGTVWREDGPDQLCDPIPVIRDGDGLISVTRSA